jgi:NADPH-ferrihemoprotein reductase
VSITAVLVDYETKTKRQMKGVATGWLQYKRPTETEQPKVPVFVRKSQFRLPFKPTVPVILIGPGTGLAPFRGFLQERYSAKLEGRSVYWCCELHQERHVWVETRLKSIELQLPKI